MMIAGPIGQLEILESQPVNVLRLGVALICHPHPLFQGTMHNKVVYTLAKAFEAWGVKTLRFNYRGVGASAGHYGEGAGETEDALFLYDYLKQQYPHEAIYVAGFSFGGYIAARVADARSASALVTVAPSVENFDFAPLQIRCPWLVVQPMKDEVVDPEAVMTMAAGKTPLPNLIRFEETGHFFHGQLTELRQAVLSWLSTLL